MKPSTKLILYNILSITLTLLTGLVTIAATNQVYTNMAEHIAIGDAFKLGFLLMGSIVLFFLMAVSSLNLRERTHNQVLFYFILVIANLHMICIISAMSGVGSLQNLFIAEMASLISTPTILIVFWFYQRNIYCGENYKKTKLDWFVLIAGLIDHAQLYFTGFKGMLFYFDENHCLVNKDMISFTYIYPVMVLILCIVDNFRNKTTREKHIACFLFSFTPLVMAVIAVVTKDYVYSHVAYVIGILIIYVGIQANMELEKVKKEESFALQKKLLENDVLTELYSRFAYSRDIDKMQAEDELDKDLVIFAMDVNGLKAANDTKGHEAGDELIKGSADCIRAALSPYGKSYRTGGDEFVSILNVPSDQVEQLVSNLRNETKNWHGKLIDELSISIGTAVLADNPDTNLKKLLRLADQSMYEDKERYYLESGRNRRRAR